MVKIGPVVLAENRLIDGNYAATWLSLSIHQQVLYRSSSAFQSHVWGLFWIILADDKIDHLHSLLWRSETECTNTLYMHDLIATYATISCKILVKISPAVSAENRLKYGNCAATRLQFDDRRPFVALAFENELKYWNFDFSVFIGHQCSTLCEILVRFSSVTPEFKT